ncbi:MAG: hypothetical protein M0Z43_04485 [Acidithiobacillus sp.]|nr:hypothetical protein [Acidithiobacillus sp.]
MRAKIGEKTRSRGGKEIPTKIDYIKFVDGEQNKIQAVHDILGDRPTEFIAVLPSDDPDQFWWRSYRRWKASGLVCHGNGEIGIVEESGEEISCPCQHAGGEQPECKIAGSLKVIIPNLPSIGICQIDTRAASSTNNIQWAIDMIGAITGGHYMGIPLRVYIEPFKSRTGISYAWKMDIMSTPDRVVLAAAEQTRGHLSRLIPAEFLQIDESRPEPEALPPVGEEPTEPQAEMPENIAKLKRETWERAKMAGWTAAKAKAEWEAGPGQMPDGFPMIMEAEKLLKEIEDQIAADEAIPFGGDPR